MKLSEGIWSVRDTEMEEPGACLCRQQHLIILACIEGIIGIEVAILLSFQ